MQRPITTEEFEFAQSLFEDDGKLDLIEFGRLHPSHASRCCQTGGPAWALREAGRRGARRS